MAVVVVCCDWSYVMKEGFVVIVVWCWCSGGGLSAVAVVMY